VYSLGSPPGPAPSLVSSGGAFPLGKLPATIYEGSDDLRALFFSAFLALHGQQRNWRGESFSPKRVIVVRDAYKLRSHFERLRQRRMLTGDQIAPQLGVSSTTVPQLGRYGVLTRYLYGNNHRCLYEPPRGGQLIRGAGVLMAAFRAARVGGLSMSREQAQPTTMQPQASGIAARLQNPAAKRRMYMISARISFGANTSR
jgi:hypothetical protein